MEVDGLIRGVRGCFEQIADHRASNCQYKLWSNLMGGFAIFHQKDPSLLAFREQLAVRRENLARIYSLEKIPEDTGFRKCLDGVDPALLRPAFAYLLNAAQVGGVLARKRALGGKLLVSFDGTGYFSSASVCCPHCLTKEHRNGSTTYHHQLLGAVVVHPEEATVLPVFAEAIANSDGATKNDCERNALKRLLPQVRQMLENEEIVALLDGLYADAPTIRALAKANMDYFITLKEGYVLVQTDRLRQRGELQSKTLTVGRKKQHFRWKNGLILNGANQDIHVNYFEIEEIDLKTGKTTYKNTWITNLEITKDNIQNFAQAARSRWKIENETFNTLKNQGFHLEHNYGHGAKFLSTVFALLMLLAFSVDQLAQAADPHFIKARAAFKTNKGFFKRVNSVFDLIPSMSMNAIFRFIAGEVSIQITQIE